MLSRDEITVLFVDDEPDILRSLNRFLRREPYRKLFAESGARALELVAEQDVAVIVSDLRMPEMNGLQLISEVKRQRPLALRLILSGSQDFEMIINSINKGEVFRFVPKPVEPDEFRGIIDDAIDYYCLKAEREALFQELSRKNGELTQANSALEAMAIDLRRSEEKFRSMTDAAHDAVFMVNRQGTIVYRNSAAQLMFGYDDGGARAQPFMDIVAPECRHFELPDAVYAPGSPFPGTDAAGVRRINGIRRDGSVVPLEVSVGSVQLDAVPHLVLVARDITARVEAERSRQRYEQLEQELESAIEQKLLQGTFAPMLNGAAASRMTLSSGHLNGDFTDCLVYNDHHADFIIGDVMGHGIQSALIGAGLKSMFLKVHAENGSRGSVLPPLGEIAAGLHELCIRELFDLGSFATLLFLRCDFRAGVCSMVNCGHPPLLHFRAAEGRCHLLEGANLPMGMIAEQEYHTSSFRIGPGDLLLLYSDGITECCSGDGRLFGVERLVALVESAGAVEPSVIVQQITGALAAYSGRSTFDDDMTCIAVRVG